MTLSTVVSGFSLGLAIAACGLTGALSLRAGVEPLYAVVRGIAAFSAALFATRWAADVLDSLQPSATDRDQASAEFDVDDRPSAGG